MTKKHLTADWFVCGQLTAPASDCDIPLTIMSLSVLLDNMFAVGAGTMDFPVSVWFWVSSHFWFKSYSISSNFKL